MARQIRNDVKRELSQRLLMKVMDNLNYVLNSAVTEKEEFSGVNDYGLMKAAFALTLKEESFEPRSGNTKRLIEELMAERFPEEIEEAEEAR